MIDPAPSELPTSEFELELFCPGCGYSLRGIESGKCPECGLAVDRSAAAVSRIPWEHRRRIGNVRAYWRTLWISSKAVGQDVVRPVCYRDARLFQIVTVLIASLPLVVMAALPLPAAFLNGLGGPLRGWPIALPPGWAIDLALPLVAGVGVRFALPVAIVLLFLSMTGVASYFFHPPHLTTVQQNRAIALSYYASAPIVLLVLPALVAWVFLLLHIYRPGWDNKAFFEAALMGMVMAFAPILTLLLTWISTIRMLCHTTLCSTARAFALAITLPIAWLALAVLILVGLPWLVGFVMLVVWSS